MVESILAKMQSEIKKYGLNILNTYPDDLLRHDRNILQQFALDGASIAWVVGHHHTHLVHLGLHPDENIMVNFLTALSSDDRFYLIKISNSIPAVQEVTRSTFSAFANTPIPYAQIGTTSSFAIFKGDTKVGTVEIKQKGSYDKQAYLIEMIAESTSTCLDHFALQIWAGRAAVELSGSLFVQTERAFTVRMA